MTDTQSKPATDAARIARGGLRTFFNIARDWRLDTEQAMRLLGLTSRSTYFKWKNDPASARLSPDALERLSYIFGIYKNLQILLPKPEAADGWIHRPNTAALFGGQSALERMLAGHVADLYEVRQYLDAQRGWS
ncbi:MAG: MbcA/ParS/Xre antitoxin family protein [Gammaproteobacteria bacterium]